VAENCDFFPNHLYSRPSSGEGTLPILKRRSGSINQNGGTSRQTESVKIPLAISMHTRVKGKGKGQLCRGGTGSVREHWRCRTVRRRSDVLCTIGRVRCEPVNDHPTKTVWRSTHYAAPPTGCGTDRLTPNDDKYDAMQCCTTWWTTK